ncbi:hypothetical protein Y1Q_0013538 [Alligator mississippiensis]|uniref:Uncharacterized protein n=1 Tax=Alligator mississippiensis TaxID=8496 RepID=A0A151P350_ALLMI|nr:hypothetical protein Y1Q_0013538 [Alligator mississippiensis]
MDEASSWNSHSMPKDQLAHLPDVARRTSEQDHNRTTLQCRVEAKMLQAKFHRDVDRAQQQDTALHYMAQYRQSRDSSGEESKRVPAMPPSGSSKEGRPRTLISTPALIPRIPRQLRQTVSSARTDRVVNALRECEQWVQELVRQR